MCEFHESTCNGFGDIWWTDNPFYFSSIDKAGKQTSKDRDILSMVYGALLMSATDTN